ncbi:sensor histidine kinase [Streptomyces sp. NPDC056716]|uniref:sensor histidine kinase n=1 Tax=unclassified Streptomyces TaxID=2593676 RepID=UPI0036C2150C
MAARLSRLPRPHRFDVRIALAGLIGGVALAAVGLGTRPKGGMGVLFDGPWPLLVPLVVICGAEVLRRTAPAVALPVATLALLADQFTQGSLVTIVMFTDVMYAAVLYGTPGAARRIPRITGMLSVLATIVPFALWRVPEALLIGVATGIVAFGPASTGLIVRNHREAADTARLRAEQTALLAEMDRTQAVTAERARVARELHDMVANHLSAIAIHSSAALSLDNPDTSRDALGVIRENSVLGLAEMRRLIGILRDDSGDGADREPSAAPTLDGLDALIGAARANGLDATLAAGHREQLPAPVEMAAYRIVQESLTNALKHAGPGPVAVTLDLRDGSLAVTVTSPYGDRDGPRAPGSGAGLVGMRERATLLHGTFGAGPEDAPQGKIWAVRACLPVAEGESE